MAENSWNWLYSTIRWLSFPGPLHIIRYEDLKTNLRHEIHELTAFLGVNATKALIDCVITNSEGQFHRSGNQYPEDPFSFIDRKTLDLLDTFSAAVESTIVLRSQNTGRLS